MKKTALFLTILATAAIAAVSLRAQDEKKSEAKAPSKSGLVAGYRGFTLTLPGTQLAFLNKGERVDMLVTFEAKMKDETKEKVTATILQNVMVIALRMPANLQESGAVELEVNPNEGQYAALAVQQGSVQLLARADGDTKMTPMEMASFRKLFR